MTTTTLREQSDLGSQVKGLVLQALGPSGAAVCVRGIWPNQAVVAIYPPDGGEERLWSYPVTINDAGKVALGPATELVETMVPKSPMTEAAAGALIEAVTDGQPTGSRYMVRIIRGGMSGNGNYYPDAVLREAAPKFEGARVFAKSDGDHLAGRGKDVRNLVGQLTTVAFVEGAVPDAGELRAVLTLIDPAEPIAVKLREAVARGMAGLFGLSIDAVGRAKTAQAGGRAVRTATSISKVHSVDLIVEPGAGGGVIDMIEGAGAGAEGEDQMLRSALIEAIKTNRPALLAGKDPATLDDATLEALFTEALASVTPPAATTTATADTGELVRVVEAQVSERLRRLERMRRRLQASALPPRAQERLVAEFESQASFTEAAVDARIKAEIAYLAPGGGGAVADLGDAGRITVTEGQSDKVAQMLEAFFDPAHPDHRQASSFRECYIQITGDRQVTGRRRDCDPARLREAVGTGDFSDTLGDSLTRRMIQVYRSYPEYDLWRLASNVVPVTDFRTQERVAWGGFGDLPVVAQGEPYVELDTPPDRDPSTYAVQKRGGLYALTIELIKNDDVGVIRSLPVKAARAAKRTLAKFVLDPLTSNPAIYDGKALFHTDHGNLGTAALAGPAWAACRLAMVKQTEDGSGDRIGVGPKYLWLPAELEEAAYNLFQRSTNLDKTFVQSLVPTIVPVPFWTDATDWVATADPLDIPLFEVGFLDNNQEPEFWTQDSPTSGSLFSNDQITYKIRHVYGRGILDFRGAYKAVVA